MNETVRFDTEHKRLNSKNIISEPRYQRQVNFTRVKKIVSLFNPNLVNELKVSFRDGKYYVFDGQHTLKALILHNNGEDLMVECKVYYGMTIEDEAYLFAQQTGISRKVETTEKLKALYLAGDVDVVEFFDFIKTLGIICDVKKTSQADNTIVCHKCAYDIFQKKGKSHLGEILSIIKDAWDGDPSGFRREMLSGMSIFVSTYNGEYDREALIKRLKNVSPSLIIREGKAVVGGQNRRFARQILNIYNAKLRTGRLTDRF